MSVISFTGTVNTTLWLNATVNPGSQSRPPEPDGFPYNTLGDIVSYNPFDTKITWNTNPPNIIDGKSINQIVATLYNNQQVGSNNYSISNSHVFTISGTQGGDEAFINIVLFESTSQHIFIAGDDVAALINNSGNNQYCNQTTCPTFTYNQPSLISGFIPFEVQANPWNNAGGANWTVNNFTVNVVMTVTINFFCSGISLNTEVCTQACETPDNLKNGLCFQNYLDFCFSPAGSGATGPVIFENGGNNNCNTYFESYLGQQGPGPNPQLDQELSRVCSFITDLDEFNDQPTDIQGICACHINPAFYQNIENSVNSLPGGQVVDVPAVCLFQPCVSSVYKPNFTGKVCPVVPCINIADIENNGTIKGGTTINQSCLNTSSSTSITNYLVFIIPAGIIILIVIIVILVLIFKFV